MPSAKVKETKKLFKQNCAKCHGEDGAGETTAGEIAGAPDFTDQKWQELADDERLANSIVHGRAQMPSFGKKFTKEQIKSLVCFVRTFKN
jgi:mono/diheme cytochrome c family protein